VIIPSRVSIGTLPRISVAAFRGGYSFALQGAGRIMMNPCKAGSKQNSIRGLERIENFYIGCARHDRC